MQLKHIEIDEVATTRDRVALRVLRGVGPGFHECFNRILATRRELMAFQPEISGQHVWVNYGDDVAFFFDRLVESTWFQSDHDAELKIQISAYDEAEKAKRLSALKKQHGLEN